jgi:putative toxin-antitoxin system antitoxin component (TIGR02293 family)
MELQPTLEFLGGKKALKKDVRDIPQLEIIVHTGFSFQVVESVSRRLDVAPKILVEKIALSPRTAVRRVAGRSKLRADESDRLMRIVRVAQKARSVFGSTEKARRWLKVPLAALGGKTPFSAMDTDLGASQTQEVLQRIEEGVLS